MIPIIVSILFLLATIYPVLPIMGLYLDGGLLGIVEDIFFDKGEKGATQILLLNWIINVGLSTYSFILFVSVKKPWLKVLFSILTITFLYYFFVFIFMVKYEATMSPYFFYFIPSLLSCILFNTALIIRDLLVSRFI